MRTTARDITTLRPEEVFVFGSNLAGRHGAGAAYTAKEKFGALPGVGEGRTGQSYAIPTKDLYINTLGLPEIALAVTRFIVYAKKHPELRFLVTEIGCGFAGYSPKHIAPLFLAAVDIENIYLPVTFWAILR